VSLPLFFLLHVDLAKSCSGSITRKTAEKEETNYMKITAEHIML
jgi:hypothetical protein